MRFAPGWVYILSGALSSFWINSLFLELTHSFYNGSVRQARWAVASTVTKTALHNSPFITKNIRHSSDLSAPYSSGTTLFFDQISYSKNVCDFAEMGDHWGRSPKRKGIYFEWDYQWAKGTGRRQESLSHW